MHLLSDIICAFGSRIGIGVYPADKTAYFMRNGRFPGIPMKLEVGVRLDGHEYMLPLAPGGEAFSFVEQEMTPTTLTLTGIDAARALSVQLTLTSLFRPQDVRFSTTPAVLVDVRVKRLKTRFRWRQLTILPRKAAFLSGLTAKFLQSRRRSRASTWTIPMITSVRIPPDGIRLVSCPCAGFHQCGCRVALSGWHCAAICAFSRRIWRTHHICLVCL